MVKIILRLLFLALLPALLILFGAGKMESLFPESAKPYEIYAYVLGLVTTSLILPLKAEKQKRQTEQQEKMISLLLSNVRTSFNDKLRQQFKSKDLELNIRLFRPEKGVKARLNKLFRGTQKFYIISHPNLSSDGLDGLKFRVTPPTQGIVGKAYVERSLLYDNNLQNNAEDDIYSLTKTHRHKTDGTAFVIASPIIGENEKITAIVSFDSHNKVNLPATDEWKHTVRTTCAIIHKCIPFICKNN